MNIKSVLWSQNSDHYARYKSLGNVFYMVDVDKTTSIADSSPFTLDMGVIISCKKGSINVGVDMQICHLEEDDMLFILPGQIIEQQEMSDEFYGKMAIYSPEFFSGLHYPINFPIVLYNIDSPVVHLNPTQSILIESYSQTFTCMSEAELREAIKNESFQYLCLSLLLIFKDEISDSSQKSMNQTKAVSKKFLKLLSENFREHKDLQFYSDRMNLSKKYFSVLIKSETGKTASEWIDEFIVLEAKKDLATTDLTIQQISNKLNFANQSFFGKFFKRITGLSPKAYRKTLLA